MWQNRGQAEYPLPLKDIHALTPEPVNMLHDKKDFADVIEVMEF